MISNTKENNYRFIMDTLFIFFMWNFLVISESYIIYKTIFNLQLKNITVSSNLIGLYLMFALSIYVINGFGCFSVWKSISENKDKLKYYE